MNDQPRKILCYIIRENGKFFFRNEKQFRAIFNDLSRGEFVKERRCISDSIAQGVPETLLKKDNLPYSHLESQLTDRLANYGFDQNLARWTVKSWAIAFGISSEEIAQENFGVISIVSDPLGAEIFLNEKKVGVAPIDINGLREGQYSIKARFLNHLPWNENILLSDGEKRTIHVNLTRSTPNGDILIDSYPQGAIIYIDSHHNGATPKRINNLHVGIHELVLTHPGFKNYSRNISINQGKNPDFIHQLIPVVYPEKSQIAILSHPSNAEVYLDGNYIDTTPVTLKRATVGTHQLVLKKTGYSDFVTTISIKPGKNPDVFWKFEQQQPQINEPRLRTKTQLVATSLIAVCFAALIFSFLGFINIPSLSTPESQPTITTPVPTTIDPRSGSVFMPENNVIEDNLPGGYAKKYYFEVENPTNIRFIRIRLEARSDFDFILGKNYIPTFVPEHYDRIADIGLISEEMDIYNPEQGLYFVTVKGKDYDKSSFSIVKTTYHK